MPSTSAGRVIAGTARGIRLSGPGAGTRPLGDRVKESLFAILEPLVRDGVFLDLFAGSGAAGIEALSRGAARAVFVERDAGAADEIRRNLAATHLADRAEVVRADVATWLARNGATVGPVAAILIDPPYDRPDLVTASLAAIAASGPAGILDWEGLAVVKHSAKAEPPSALGLLRSDRERRFGATTLTFLRWHEEEAP